MGSPSPHPLAGRTCLVTGAGSGVGQAIATAFADAGARVWGCDINPNNLATTRSQLARSQAPTAVTLERVDVTDRSAVEQWIATAHEATGRIDVLVNNAAFVSWADVTDASVADAERTMRTAYDAMVYAVTAGLPTMLAAGRGHIITIGSSAGRIYAPGPSAAYAAAKAAQEAYTRILQLELAPTPVHATLVRPGVITGTQFFGDHVPSSRLPRLADFLPTTTAPHVATAVTAAVLRPRNTIDLPRYLPLAYLAHAVAPRTLQRLAQVGGPSRRDFGAREPTGR
ncbi:SDR family NAD(P)-dependent oxidoreductase [Streptomyces alanosinicus]|uniref:SDR family NAD(P)-dependent oxidoreductase n=1 Tax=Streptomyces alanosinicus TaxID=68171 RepID=A0A918YKX4_9ACTN|nr:SDR family oxidoreductase [Streptomyces alanosinicus]GHE06560.1 hypothetical protein GCM10010339_47580 [Streptomyces alanosinicus]